MFSCCIKNSFIHSLVFILEGQAWQKPEPSHVTGMPLAHCILGKFLGVVCHCFPLMYLYMFFYNVLFTCIVIYPYNMNQQDALFSINYFNSKPLYVSSRLAAEHQEDQLCLNSNWYIHHNAWLYQIRFIKIWSAWWCSKPVYTELILLMISNNPARNI